jgi:glycosyltransferase involved in cell wall biosynthesis
VRLSGHEQTRTAGRHRAALGPPRRASRAAVDAMSPLHVLVYGAFTNGACNVYRFGILERALAAHGVELRSFAGARIAVPTRDAASVDRMYASEDLVLDRSELDWADVIVFRRFYSTRWTCLDCAFVDRDSKRASRHAATVRHEVCEPDRLIRPLYNALETYPEVLRGRAIVYETDDDLLNIQPWNGMRNRTAHELDLVERMLRRADLVTVSTPTLRSRLAGYNDEIRVLRNAVEPAWYTAPDDAPEVEGDPRLLYYGSPARFRDYLMCQPAVDEVVRETPAARRVWLGALNARAGGGPSRVLAAVDEAGPFVDSPEAFAAALTAARPDIGLAPLVGDAFDQAKSELHWLEYTMAGAATIASLIPGGGPYDPIRHGVDGLLVTSQDDWLRELRRLAASPAFRGELVGRARERVLAEYTVDVRAAEWADAYRWAAEHAGRRAQGRVHGLGALDGGDLERHGRASLAARVRSRAALSAAPDRLDAARRGRASCGTPTSETPAMVSVIIPIADEAPEAVERALRSVLTGSHQALEVVLAADAGWPHDLLAVVAAVAPGDPRVRLTVHDVDAALPPSVGTAQTARRGRLLVAGVACATGDWIAPLAPDAFFTPDHVALLLGIAQAHELEFVYGQAEVTAPGAPNITLGAWPPSADGVLTVATELFAAPLAAVLPLDADAWREAETTSWAFWRSALAIGVRMAGIEHPVTMLSPLPMAETAGVGAPAAAPSARASHHNSTAGERGGAGGPSSAQGPIRAARGGGRRGGRPGRSRSAAPTSRASRRHR